jgi:hypothetical protein
MWFEREVPKWTQKLLGTCAEWLATKYEVHHTITVNVPASGYILLEGDEKQSYGLFGYLNEEPHIPMIWIAGYWYYWKGKLADTRLEAQAHLLDTLIHEFIHYEQWRDGRSLNHRGLNRRVDSLARRFYYDHQEYTAVMVQ